jgi:hypothetical protein
MNSNLEIVIAKICHQANKAWCEFLNDKSQVDWEKAPDWQKESAINGVKFRLQNPSVTPKDMHDNWLKEKKEQGWKFGMFKDVDKKEHPCMVEYEDLPESQKLKDHIFSNIVKTFIAN